MLLLANLVSRARLLHNRHNKSSVTEAWLGFNACDSVIIFFLDRILCLETAITEGKIRWSGGVFGLSDL